MQEPWSKSTPTRCLASCVRASAADKPPRARVCGCKGLFNGACCSQLVHQLVLVGHVPALAHLPALPPSPWMMMAPTLASVGWGAGAALVDTKLDAL